MKASTVFLHSDGAQTARRRSHSRNPTMSNPLTLLAELKARPALADELGTRLQALLAPTRRGAGRLRHARHRSGADPDLFVLYESWRSRRDLDEHLATPYLLDFFAQAPRLLAQDVAMRFFSPAIDAQVA